MKDHEKNYSPFLLEAAALVWGMDHFNEYLKGKKFILYTDHKPLEKLGHLHSKTMNRFQTALLEHNFIIQYKKGSDMPADYLSRLPATVNDPVIAAFDPFQARLGSFRKKKTLQKISGILDKRNNGQLTYQRRTPMHTQSYYKKCFTTKMAFYG